MPTTETTRNAEPTPFAVHETIRLAGELDQRAVEIKRLRGALQAAEAEARRYAEFYPQFSEGRNTLLILADRIAGLGAAP